MISRFCCGYLRNTYSKVQDSKECFSKNYIDVNDLEIVIKHLSENKSNFYIKDLVAAYIVSVETLQRQDKFGYQEYFISSQNKISLKKLVKKYLKITGQKARIDFGAKEYRDREIMKPFSSKKNLPGWKPKINLDDGLKKLIEK